VGFVVIWALFGCIAALIANGRGANGCGWFIAGVFFGPFALIAALMSSGRRCPQCQSMIHDKAVRCPKCSSDIGPSKPPLRPEPTYRDNSSHAVQLREEARARARKELEELGLTPPKKPDPE